MWLAHRKAREEEKRDIKDGTTAAGSNRGNLGSQHRGGKREVVKFKER